MSQHDLFIQYRKARGDLVKLRNRVTDKEDRKHLADMIADCEFIAEWLSTGRRPGSRRGVERRSIYELTKVWDPEWFEDFIPPVAVAAEYELTLSDEFNIEEALTSLSERERQCYVLHVGFKYSMMQISYELKIKKASVQTHIKRAKQKIKLNIVKGLIPSSG